MENLVEASERRQQIGAEQTSISEIFGKKCSDVTAVRYHCSEWPIRILNFSLLSQEGPQFFPSSLRTKHDTYTNFTTLWLKYGAQIQTSKLSGLFNPLILQQFMLLTTTCSQDIGTANFSGEHLNPSVIIEVKCIYRHNPY